MQLADTGIIQARLRCLNFHWLLKKMLYAAWVQLWFSKKGPSLSFAASKRFKLEVAAAPPSNSSRLHLSAHTALLATAAAQMYMVVNCIARAQSARPVQG